MFAQRRWLFYGVGALLALITIGALMSGRWQMVAAFLLPAIVFIVVWRRLMRNTYRKVFEQEEYLKHPVSYVFSDKNIETSSFNGSGTMEWHSILTVAELNDFFLLYQTKNMAIPIFKSAFTDQAEEVRFRDLLRSKGMTTG